MGIGHADGQLLLRANHAAQARVTGCIRSERAGLGMRREGSLSVQSIAQLGAVAIVLLPDGGPAGCACM